MTKAFLVTHVHVLASQEEDLRIIGIFTTRERAEAAIRAASKLPGFADTAEAFEVSEYELDDMCWREGFVTL